jgi:hypothetical protein
MSNKREHYVGVRLTKSEKELLNKIITKRKISLTDFLRDAIFSHLKYIEEEDRYLNLRGLNLSINEIKTAINKIDKNIVKIDEEIHLYGLKGVR